MQCVSAEAGQLKIDCVGIGVGVVFHNRSRKVGVGVHVLAPRSSGPNPDNPAKYADSAIPYALEMLGKLGAARHYTVAIAGGAAMSGYVTGAGIGAKIVEAVKEALSKEKLTVGIDKTGGSNIRSMILDVETGNIQIR